MDKLLRGTELAEKLGVSRWTVRDWRMNKGMPAVFIGPYYRYRMSEVEEWLSKNKEGQQ